MFTTTAFSVIRFTWFWLNWFCSHPYSASLYLYPVKIYFSIVQSAAISTSRFISAARLDIDSRWKRILNHSPNKLQTGWLDFQNNALQYVIALSSFLSLSLSKYFSLTLFVSVLLSPISFFPSHLSFSLSLLPNVFLQLRNVWISDHVY